MPEYEVDSLRIRNLARDVIEHPEDWTYGRPDTYQRKDNPAVWVTAYAVALERNRRDG